MGLLFEWHERKDDRTDPFFFSTPCSYPGQHVHDQSSLLVLVLRNINSIQCNPCSPLAVPVQCSALLAPKEPRAVPLRFMMPVFKIFPGAKTRIKKWQSKSMETNFISFFLSPINMRTRQSKGMMDSSEATPHTPPSHDLEMELDTNMASPTEEKAVSTINHPDIATTQSQPKDSRKAKKRPTTKDSSTKRTRTKPYDLPKLSYSASLPKIVWVFDRQYQWWPGEVSIGKCRLI